MNNKITNIMYQINSKLVLCDVDVQRGLEEAKTAFLTQIQPIINFIIIPILELVLAVFLIFQIASAGVKKKQGQEWNDKLVPIFVLVVVMILLGSAPLWVWSMIGV